MKDLGPEKHILGMSICRDWNKHKLWLSQEKYIDKVLKRFHMKKVKLVATPFASHFSLSSKQSPTSVEKGGMHKVPHASVICSLMYAMVCTRVDITHMVGIVSRYLENPRKDHWNDVKWIL